MKYLCYAIVTLLAISSCRQPQDKSPTIQVLQTNGAEALGPYFTKDNYSNAVLCWTEKDRIDSVHILKYAYFDDKHNTFGPPISVLPSKGMSTTAESMGKVAFKGDGTAFAFFSRRFEHEKNPFAGAIYYSSSSNKGKTWSSQRFLHSDTSHTYGRSFFDVSKLRNGQIAAVWLDGRFGKSIKGSALYFAHTENAKGFERDSCLDKGTCECCRTDLLQDKSGNLHLAYRSILYPPERMGKQVRDMVYKVSTDNGRTFSFSKTISRDNWEIDACPHSGPTIAVNPPGLNAVWFTAGGAPGLYTATKLASSAAFKQRNLLTANGRHPQMISLADGRLAMVCEEPVENTAEMPMKMGHGHAGMEMSHAPAAAAKIILRILQDGNATKIIELTNGHYADNHAVITVDQDAVLVAWIREENGHSSIRYSRVGSDIMHL
jgi:hypothetical protein